MKTKVRLVFLFMLTACAAGEIDIQQEGVLSKEEMINVIADIQLLEGAHKSISVNSKTRRLIKDTSFQVIYNKYGIDSLILDSSMRVYTRYPKLMAEITEKAAQQLNTIK